jgi:M6 family metalloprotease-like protein
MTLAVDDIDYSTFDTNGDTYVTPDELAIVIVVAGYEESFSKEFSPSIWGHQFYLNNPVNLDGVNLEYYAMFGEQHGTHQATFGIVAHELGHLIFDLPDLYDTDDTSSGIGGWGLMGGGSWGSQINNGEFAGKTPVNPSAYVKYKLGWAAGSTSNGVVSVTGSGSSSANNSNSVYRVTTPNSSEYFLVENRQFSGYDRGLSRFIGARFGGISIWHIDESVSANNNDNIRLVDIEEAGNSQMVDSEDQGSAANLWVKGESFNSGSSPSSSLNLGGDSGVSIAILSNSAETMEVNFGFPSKEESDSCFLSSIID